MKSARDVVYEAGVVLTGTGDAHVPGVVAVRGGEIVSVGGARTEGTGRRREFPEAVIIPGLVNAHCHADLSFLEAPLGFDGSFLQWLMKVGWARSRAGAEECETAARRSLRELAGSGVTAVGDITAIEGGYRALRDSRLRGVVYLETIGFKKERVEAEKERLEGLLKRCPATGRVRVGISPHAPYTVGPRLWDLLRREYAARIERFSVHVSEVLEEAAFLEGGWGPFRLFLWGAGLLESSWKPPGMSPLEYVESFGFVRRGTSLVHANFLTEDDRALLAQRQEEGPVCVVHCPRSHRFFRRLPFPVEELSRERIPVALGTDSLASNESFDMLAEMRTLRSGHPGLPAADILRMGTLRGAQALGLDETTGTIEEGKRADLAVIDVSATAGGLAPEERILHPAARCVLTVVDGEPVFEREGGG